MKKLRLIYKILFTPWLKNKEAWEANISPKINVNIDRAEKIAKEGYEKAHNTPLISFEEAVKISQNFYK